MSSDLDGKTMLILGAGTWQVPYYVKAKSLGLRICATDWSPTAVGAPYADVFSSIDLKNKEATLQFAREQKVGAVFTPADIGVQTAAYVASQLDLPCYSEELALNASNKFAMRNRALASGLPIPAYRAIETVAEALIEAPSIGFPLIMKPVDNFSSRGVSVVYSEEELMASFQESFEASFSGKVLLEEFMQGTEGSVEALVQNGEVHVLGICDKEKSALPFRYDLQLHYPGNYSEKQFARIDHFIDHLVKAYEIQDGIIHVEIMVSDEQIRLIEFAIRGCGSKVITHLLPQMLNFDIMGYLLHLAFGIKKPINIKANHSGTLKFIMLKHGKLKKISGLADAAKVNHVIDIDIEAKPGNVIGDIKDGRSRPGYALVYGKDRAEISETIDKMMQKISITYY